MSELVSYIDQLIKSNKIVKPLYDMSSKTDVMVMARMAYFKYGIPLMQELEVKELSEEQMHNCILDMYTDLKKEGKIANVPPLTLP